MILTPKGTVLEIDKLDRCLGQIVLPLRMETVFVDLSKIEMNPVLTVGLLIR